MSDGRTSDARTCPRARLFGFAGYSGSGKTTMLERLIPELVRRGLVVSVIKHAHHAFDIDQPGKDSFRHREAGATEVLISSHRRWALMRELRGEAEPTLQTQLELFSPCDIVLVEGYKRETLPKIEVHRGANGKPWLYPEDPSIIAIATDLEQPANPGLPVYHLDDIPSIAEFVAGHAEPLPWSPAHHRTP